MESGALLRAAPRIAGFQRRGLQPFRMSQPNVLPPCPQTEEQLEDFLSTPSPEVVNAVARLQGDIAVLGVGGKMGPTLACMARRAMDAAGRKDRVIGVARFTDRAAEDRLRRAGVETVRCDLLDRDSVARLPDAPSVIYMVGQKFGTTEAPERTWAVNALASANAAEYFAGARILAFSTGCVYPHVPMNSGGSREQDALEPLGEYANSCVARERILAFATDRTGSSLVHLRLNYAIDLRYGVLLDVARRVLEGRPIDLTIGYVNVIWQGDACATALRLLEHAARPPLAVNVTGPERVSIRDLAERFGALLDRRPVFAGAEGPSALLSNARRMRQLLGDPAMPIETMVRWTAEWLATGRPTWDKPTHFEVRDGRY